MPSFIKVEEESDLEVRESQVGEQLLRVHWSKPALDGFHLDDHTLLHEQIDAEAVLEVDVVEGEVDPHLTLDAQPTPLESSLQQPLVHSLEQSRPRPLMYPDRLPHDCPCDVVQFHGSSSTSMQWAALSVSCPRLRVKPKGGSPS